ncbi:hypothetical protein [Enhygromyxa salina]|uniref:Outer membrane protein beta-barrel domain-containing protein n=1 Tax=Enhygromyxa salina TaxID=215803 RepID=A0A2S9YQB0_9BACT|nr:hypothetical protein [Enhygromyxa salina]PRQ07281.1 hypothetical protein ENSA7_29890 [Enhygromyxa salina]
MSAGLLAAALLCASPAPPAPPAKVAPTLAELDERRFELHLGGRAGARFGGAPSLGGGGSIGLGVRLWRGLYLEASVGEGVFSNARPAPAPSSFRHLGSHAEVAPGEPDSAGPPVAAAAAASDDAASALLAGQILLGVRYEVRTPRTKWVRPTVFLGATHLHEATLGDLARAPGPTLAGTGEFIRHRTGVQLGVGLRAPLPERWGPVAPRFSVRVDADAAYYFDAHPGRVQAGLGVGVQVVF